MGLRSSDGAQRATLSVRQRIALFQNTMALKEILQVDDNDINIDLIKKHNVKAKNIRNAKMTVLDLKSFGLSSALELRELEFDALDLCDSVFCASAVAAFGVADVLKSFLLDAGDAVALAGSVGIYHLHITTQKLLECCAGCPEQAKAVLQQTDPRGGALRNVLPTVLLDTGLRATTLCELGYFLNNIREQTNASVQETHKLGFK